MSSNVKTISVCILLVLLQVILDCFLSLGIFVHLCIIPLVIIALPYKWKAVSAMSVAFTTGLVTDILTGGILGINAAAATLVAGIRNPLCRHFLSTDDTLPTSTPSSGRVGVSPYLKYLFLTCLAYSATFAILDGLSFSPVSILLVRTAVSSAASTALCFCLDLMVYKKD